jgi:hypothetical protein
MSLRSVNRKRNGSKPFDVDHAIASDPNQKHVASAALRAVRTSKLLPAVKLKTLAMR